MKNIFSRKFVGFTMAEILLSLTIIGVVAAITLPSLTGNINERTWATQKKALYARMSQAFPLLDSVNSYDDAESFIAGALNTVTKINNVCSQENLEDCGINTSMYAAMNGGAASSFPATWSDLGISYQFSFDSASGDTSDQTASKKSDANKAQIAAFETGNGESIVMYYNPNCVPDQENLPSAAGEDWFKYVCVNMVYDLNSNKGPNTAGKDIGFMTVFYPSDPVVVSAVPDISTSSAVGTCNSDEYRVPNKYESISMALNNMFINNKSVTDGSAVFQSSSKAATSAGAMQVYYAEKNMLKAIAASSTNSGYKSTRCVKR